MKKTAKARRREGKPKCIVYRDHRGTAFKTLVERMTRKDFVHVLTRLIDEIEREYQAISLSILRAAQIVDEGDLGRVTRGLLECQDAFAFRYHQAHSLMRHLLTEETHV